MANGPLLALTTRKLQFVNKILHDERKVFTAVVSDLNECIKTLKEAFCTCTIVGRCRISSECPSDDKQMRARHEMSVKLREFAKTASPILLQSPPSSTQTTMPMIGSMMISVFKATINLVHNLVWAS